MTQSNALYYELPDRWHLMSAPEEYRGDPTTSVQADVSFVLHLERVVVRRVLRSGQHIGIAPR